MLDQTPTSDKSRREYFFKSASTRFFTELLLIGFVSFRPQSIIKLHSNTRSLDRSKKSDQHGRSFVQVTKANSLLI